jgi:hypothetical protein
MASIRPRNPMLSTKSNSLDLIEPLPGEVHEQADLLSRKTVIAVWIAGK